LRWPHPSDYWVRLSNSNSEALWPSAQSTNSNLMPKGPGVCDSLSVQYPSLHWMATLDLNWDAISQASFSGSA
ncbi:hypothetical protein, partial [Salmonella sp. s58079]|uniref:hypothetical protein n=1 Tax=Salmonella sp. s58079 TaxID=3159700 RepID=UPI003980D766